MAFKLLDVSNFLHRVDAKAVTNSRSFNRSMEPEPEGLQSRTIFGVSTKDKFEKWGSLNLEDVVMHPLIYNNLSEINAIFKRVLNKKNKYKIVNGMLVEGSDGGNGIGWLISNWSSIVFDKYRTEKNKMFIDFINNTQKNILFVNKVPVIPLVYREARMGTHLMEDDEIDALYKKILSFSKTGRSDFTADFMEKIKDTTAKEFTQSAVNQLYSYFISKLESKYGFVRGTMSGKRLDNVARLVANARPDIPVNSAAIPWQVLINIFDIFVLAFLENEENSSYKEKLGIKELTRDEYGEMFDFIYRNLDIYNKNHPQKKEVWVEILVRIFNDNPMLRVLVKRDPGWNANSIWCLQPLIGVQDNFAILCPSWLYSPLGGDSFNTDFYIDTKEDNIIFEDDDYKITGSNEKARIVRTMDSVWKNL